MINVENKKLEYFEDFKRKNNAKRYKEDCDNFELREKIREDLLIKQRNQCAYCERKIENNKNSCGIDHIRQRDKFNNLECEYSNLVLSCKDEDSCENYKDSKKNHIAKQWEDSFIHPVVNNTNEFFKFRGGRILPKNNDKDAQNTIDYLNLNSDKLVRLRKNLTLQLDNMKDIDNLSDYFFEFENLVKEYT
jgi:uncharacterized protein (TIGR02646 family)